MSISIARYIICAICVNACGKGSYWEHFGSSKLKCKELVGTSRRSRVVTSQRHDVGSTNRSQQAAASRLLNVATSQRRDIATSRHQHDSCLSIIKSKKGTRIRGGDRTKEGTEISTSVT